MARKRRSFSLPLSKPKQLHDGAEDLFVDGKSKPSVRPSDEPESAELYEQIGRLKV